MARPEPVTARSSMARRMWLAISTGCTAERRCLANVPWTARSSPASRRSNRPIAHLLHGARVGGRSRKTIRRGWVHPERRGPYRGRMNDGVQVIVPREVPLGGPRSMTVRRTLPARERSFVGAWCFVDHYGPDDVVGQRRHGRRPAPALRARDGVVAVQRRGRAPRLARAPWRSCGPGEVNLMTAGRGISHSEVSTPGTTVLHGAQLWLVLPSAVGRGRAALRAPRARGGAGRATGCGRRCSSGRCGGRRRRCGSSRRSSGPRWCSRRGRVGGRARCPRGSRWRCSSTAGR